MAKAQREWAEALAERQPLAAEEVTAFAASVASSAAAANGAGGGMAAAAASLEAVVPLALFLSRSLGKVGLWDGWVRGEGAALAIGFPVHPSPCHHHATPWCHPSTHTPPTCSSQMRWCHASW